jgi:hypothetical protein
MGQQYGGTAPGGRCQGGSRTAPTGIFWSRNSGAGGRRWCVKRSLGKLRLFRRGDGAGAPGGGRRGGRGGVGGRGGGLKQWCVKCTRKKRAKPAGEKPGPGRPFLPHGSGWGDTFFPRPTGGERGAISLGRRQSGRRRRRKATARPVFLSSFSLDFLIFIF